MSDLDKAIRADLTERARDVAPYAADRSMVTYADAIRSVLDLHTHSDVDGVRLTTGPMRQCAACGLVSRDQWCDTVNAIADDLGVSGEARSEPAPAPTWRRGNTPAYPKQVARVAKLVLAKRFAANSFVMRHLYLGYSETEACLNILESWGVVGPREGSKAREVLLPETEVDGLVQALSEVVSPEGTP